MWKIYNKNKEHIASAFLRQDAIMKAVRKGVKRNELLAITNGEQTYIPTIWKKNVVVRIVSPTLGPILDAAMKAKKLKGGLIELENLDELKEYDSEIIKNNFYSKEIKVFKKKEGN